MIQIDWKFKCPTLGYLANTTLTVGRSGNELIVKINFPQWDNQDHVNSFPVEQLAEILNDFIKSDSTMQVGVKSLRIDEGARTLVIVGDEISSANTLEDLDGYEIKLHHIGMTIIDQLLKCNYITAAYRIDTAEMSYQFLKNYKPHRCMCCGRMVRNPITYLRPEPKSVHHTEWCVDVLDLCPDCGREWIKHFSPDLGTLSEEECEKMISNANKWLFDKVAKQLELGTHKKSEKYKS